MVKDNWTTSKKVEEMEKLIQRRADEGADNDTLQVLRGELQYYRDKERKEQMAAQKQIDDKFLVW